MRSGEPREALMAVLRLGRKLGRTDGLQTLYIQRGDEPADDDPCVGMVITRDLARIIVQAVNADETFARTGGDLIPSAVTRVTAAERGVMG